MPLIGLTTGFAYKIIPPTSKKVVDICRKIGCQAIEINCIGGFADRSLSNLRYIKPDYLSGFKHVSLHTACRAIKYGKDKETKKILDVTQRAYDRLGYEFAVIHPDTILDWNIFADYTFPIAIENMDKRKKSHQNVKDLDKVFKKIPECGFVLDLNHCYTMDPTMRLADDLFRAFSDRLCEIHLSGYNEYHAPFARTEWHVKEKILWALYKALNTLPAPEKIPIIIENSCETVKEAEDDYRFVIKYLKKRGF